MSQTTYDVVAVGNAIVDILVFEEDNFLRSHSIDKGVMTLTDCTTVDKLHVGTPDARRISGGSAANTAVGVASFGGKTAFIGKVADDEMGDLFTTNIRNEGVSFMFRPPERESDESTACSYIIVTPDAQRTMLTYLGVAAHLSLSDIREEVISDAQICYLEGYLWDDEGAIECMKKAVDIAKSAGRKVAFSLSDPFCVHRHRESFLALIKENVDILFANEEEILSLYQVANLEEAIERLPTHCDVTAITLGAKGSMVISKDEVVEVAAENVAKVVDTTGAGDLYAAGFLYGYSQGKSLAECGRLASISAAEIISHIGARPETKLSNVA